MVKQKDSYIFLEHEFMQSRLRLTFISLVIPILFINYFLYDSMNQEAFIYMMSIPFGFLLLSIVYFFALKKYPYTYQLSRIKIIATMEVTASAYVMYLAGYISAYFPFFSLWCIVGYSMRYGLKVGYLVYLLAVFSWINLLIYSDYWNANLELGLGWLIALLGIPLYFFKLLRSLQNKLEEADYLSKHDSLTKLPNRLYFDSTLSKYIRTYKEKKKNFALIFVDLDDFKNINDVYGHTLGDEILMVVSKRILELCSFASRLGGDEFVAIIEYENENELKQTLDTLLKSLASEHENIEISASLGVALFGEDALCAHELKKNADLAMYEAKKNGKNKYSFYQEID